MKPYPSSLNPLYFLMSGASLSPNDCMVTPGSYWIAFDAYAFSRIFCWSKRDFSSLRKKVLDAP